MKLKVKLALGGVCSLSPLLRVTEWASLLLLLLLMGHSDLKLLIVHIRKAVSEK